MSLHPNAERAFREAIDDVHDPLLHEKLEHLFKVVTHAQDQSPTTQPKTFKNFIEPSQPPEYNEPTTTEEQLS